MGEEIPMSDERRILGRDGNSTRLLLRGVCVACCILGGLSGSDLQAQVAAEPGLPPVTARRPPR